MPIVVIDSGHEPSHLGAVGTCKQNEVVYNDAMVTQIAHVLSQSYQVILTRQPTLDVPINNPDLIHYLVLKKHYGKIIKVY